MGQKVHPKGFRLGVTDGWVSRWFATKDAARFLGEDKKVRSYVKEKLNAAGISRIDVERRGSSRVKVTIHSAKPGLVIGKKGKDIEELRKHLRGLVGKDVSLNIVEARKPDTDAQLVAESIALQLERRVNFRRAMKESIGRALRMGAEGIKIAVAGRLNGAEIARTEKSKEGRIPLHTLRADVDYGFAEARTAYGLIGVKVWVFKGEIFAPGQETAAEAMAL